MMSHQEMSDAFDKINSEVIRVNKRMYSIKKIFGLHKKS